jgi:hypothetical protein
MEQNNQLPQPPVQSSTPPQTSPPVSDNVKKGKKKVLIGLSILVISVILFIVFNIVNINYLGIGINDHKLPQLKQATSIPSQTPDPTANWKTYNSSAESYQIKYPSNWVLIEAGKTHSDSGAARYDLNEIGGEKEIQKISLAYSDSDLTLFEIAVFANSSNLTIDEIVKKDTKPYPTEVPPNSKEVVRMLKVDGINAVQYSIFGFDRQISVIAFTKNRKVYRITFDESNVNDPDFEKNNKIYEQILSTFKFTNQSTRDICDSIAGLTFQSIEKHEGGLGPNGATERFWSVSFQDGILHWSHSDVSESGVFTCSGNTIKAKSYVGTYDQESEILTWEGIKYKKLAQ